MVARSTVERPMHELDLRGAHRRRSVRATAPDRLPPADLVRRQYSSPVPSALVAEAECLNFGKIYRTPQISGPCHRMSHRQAADLGG